MVAYRRLVMESLEQRYVLSASFQGLGYLPGDTFSQASDVSSDGMTVVGTSVDVDFVLPRPEAFVWNPISGMAGLGTLPGTSSSHALGVSGDGSVVAGFSLNLPPFSPPSNAEVFRWDAGAGMVGTGLRGQGGFISADGTTIVGTTQFVDPVTMLNTNQAVRWQSGSLLGLGDLPGGIFHSLAGDVSADGSVVVGQSASASGAEAFRWESGTMVGLGDLPGGNFNSSANGISDDGLIVVGSSESSSGAEAFRWEGGTMVGLDDIPGGPFQSHALDVTADGSIVVGRSAGVAGLEAFIWDSTNGMRSLQTVLSDAGVDLTGWTLRQAGAISADGKFVVGWGTNPNGGIEAWIAELPDVSTPITVEIDVRPGSDANNIRVGSNGNVLIPVAVFTTADFDAATIDVGTVVFAGANAISSTMSDVDGDGDLDMLLFFNLQDTNLRDIYEQLLVDDFNEDGVLDSTLQTYTASLTGETTSDELFEGFDDLNLLLTGRELRDLLDALFP